MSSLFKWLREFREDFKQAFHEFIEDMEKLTNFK